MLACFCCQQNKNLVWLFLLFSGSKFTSNYLCYALSTRNCVIDYLCLLWRLHFEQCHEVRNSSITVYLFIVICFLMTPHKCHGNGINITRRQPESTHILSHKILLLSLVKLPWKLSPKKRKKKEVKLPWTFGIEKPETLQTAKSVNTFGYEVPNCNELELW